MNSTTTSTEKIAQICQKSLNDPQLSEAELVTVVNSSAADAKLIFNLANSIRQREVGDSVHLRGLIEFSNICIRKCQYCGLACYNKNIERYRMKIDEIVETAKAAEDMGYPSIVLQSGEDPYYNADRLSELIFKIKSTTKLALTLSAGEYSYEEYQQIKAAGADRYLLRFETSDETLYRRLHPDSYLQERLLCLEHLDNAGFQVGTGFMVGLPGETPQIFASNLLLLKKYNAGMVGIGPFLANQDTPMRTDNSGTVLGTLKAVALTRMLIPTANIPATTALGTLDKFGREKALQAGANVIMPNVSPMKFRELYKLYPNKMCVTADQGRDVAIKMVESIGRTVALDKGHAPQNRRTEHAK